MKSLLWDIVLVMVILGIFATGLVVILKNAQSLNAATVVQNDPWESLGRDVHIRETTIMNTRCVVVRGFNAVSVDCDFK